MDGEAVYMPLPEELVERIFAMVPFPHVFKARVLSKSWLARFSPISSHDADEERKQLAVSFQKRVGECCIKWKTFSPAFVGKENLLAYDRESQHWRRIPTLFFLPETHPGKSSRSYLEVEGAIVLISTLEDLYVANVLTRSWKQLPPRPHIDGWHYDGKKLVSHTGTYKVICLCDNVDYCLVDVYDSQLGAWSTSKRFEKPRDLRVLRQWGEYLNGVLYWVVSLNEMARGFLAFNVKEENFEVLEMPLMDAPIESDLVDLVVCSGSLLLVLYNGEFGELDKVTLLKIDLSSQRWVEVTEGPPYPLRLGNFCLGPASDGDSVFFAGENLDKILAYNVEKDEWSDFPIPASFRHEYDEDKFQLDPCSFRAGLNPFVAL